MDTQNKSQPVARSHFAQAFDRWRHGIAIVFMMFVVVAGSSLIAGTVLAILSEILGIGVLKEWKIVALLTAMTTLPYLITSPSLSEALRHLLDPKLRG